MTMTPTRRRIDGVLLLDKPAGVTSNAALQRVKRAFDAEKAGHVGTLDPAATGLLPICLGEATKFSQGLTDADKTYLATVVLGVTTSTGDAEGNVVKRAPVTASVAELESALEPLRGHILQLPPMHSALKYNGRPLYDYARAGQEVARTPRPITIFSLELRAFDGICAQLHVRCSKGTYIRTLAADIGAVLGCGAHLGSLRRIEVGDFKIGAATTLEALEQLPPDVRGGRLLPVDALVKSLPSLILDAAAAGRISHGQAIPALPGGVPGPARLYRTDGSFLGVGEVATDGQLGARRLVAASGPAVTPKS